MYSKYKWQTNDVKKKNSKCLILPQVNLSGEFWKEHAVKRFLVRCVNHQVLVLVGVNIDTAMISSQQPAAAV